MLDGVGDMFAHFLHRVRVNQRADGDAVIRAVADFQLGDGGFQFGGEGVVHAVLHQKTVGADAGLAGVAVFRGDRAGHGGVQIRVVEHDKRRVAAQLHAGFLDGGRTLGQQLRADFGAAGEGEFTHVRVGGELAADAFAGAGDHVAHPGGQPGALRQHGDRQRRERVWLAGRITPVQPAASRGRLCG